MMCSLARNRSRGPELARNPKLSKRHVTSLTNTAKTRDVGGPPATYLPPGCPSPSHDHHFLSFPSNPSRMSSLHSSCSTIDLTPPSTITLPTYDDSSSTKSWFVLTVTGYNKAGEVCERRVLCLADPQEPVASATSKLQNLLFNTFGRKRAECALLFVRPEGQNGPGPRKTFNASVENLVVHLREFGTTPSAEPVEPKLWGGGHNRLEVYFSEKS